MCTWLTCTQSPADTNTNAHPQIFACTHPPARAHKRVSAHAYTHTHTHARTRAHPPTHAHPCPCQSRLPPKDLNAHLLSHRGRWGRGHRDQVQGAVIQGCRCGRIVAMLSTLCCRNFRVTHVGGQGGCLPSRLCACILACACTASAWTATSCMQTCDS